MSLVAQPIPTKLVEDWDELADRVGAAPFARPGWVSAWWEAFGHGDLRIAKAHHSGRLTGLVPLLRHGATIRSTTNAHTPLFTVLAETDESAARLAKIAYTKHPARLELSFLDSSDVGLTAFAQEAKRQGYPTSVRIAARSPYIETSGSWEAYLASLAAKRRGELRRRRRRLEEMGELVLDVRNGEDRLDELLREGFSLEGSGWKLAQGTAISSDERTLSFYTQIAAWASDMGWLRLAFLRLDGRPIAFDFSLEAAGVHYLLKTGYAFEWRRSAPASVLRYLMIERAFLSGLQSYEFLGTVEGDRNEWKRNWTPDWRDRFRFQAFDKTVLGQFYRLRSTYGVEFESRARAWLHDVLGPRERDLLKRAYGVSRRALKL